MRSSRSGLPDAPPVAKTAAWLLDRPFAHRGLHGGGIVENSRSAFGAAISAGVGIELDVRLSRDGFAVVFHDAELERLTGASGRVAKFTVAELARLRLAGSKDGIETLGAILTFIAGRVPLLIELKTDGDPHKAARLSLSVRHALEGYRGRVGVMSFDPAVGAWFARHAPRIVRGLVVGGFVVGRPRRKRGLLRHLLNLHAARPHFIACDVAYLPSRTIRFFRRRGALVLAWTVRTPQDHALAATAADQIIFER